MTATNIINKDNNQKVNNFYFCGIEKETEKALLVNVMETFKTTEGGDLAHSKSVWMPKSQVAITDNTLLVAGWLISKTYKAFEA